MRMEVVVVGGSECVMEMDMDELGIESETHELMHVGTWDCACVVREVLAGGGRVPGSGLWGWTSGFAKGLDGHHCRDE